MTKRYIVTCAVNDSPVHKGFWSSIQTFAKHHKAEILVVAAKYKNPTAKRSKQQVDEDQTYAGVLLPYLTRKDVRLGKNLTLFASVPVQPTAGNALNGLEVYASGTSGIIGHVKRQLKVVPTDTRRPRVLWTTSAVTLPKYSKSRAGARAAKHHVIGALVVEVCGNGHFFVRNVTANSDGSFTDLDTSYTPSGAYEAERALSVTLGDIHVGQEDEAVLEATEAMVRELSPKHLVLHDVYDGSARSHHKRTSRHKWDGRFASVENEVQDVRDFLDGVARTWGAEEVDVVRSNHDEHLTRWLEEHDPKVDPSNDPYYCTLKSKCYAYRQSTGKWPNELELECVTRGVSGKVRFLKRGESLKVGGVEHGMHGDAGINGSRGSILGYSKLGVKVTVGHSHTPGILDGCFQVGVTGTLNMGYNQLPSTWCHAHVVLGADGKRQVVFIVDGQHRAE